MGSNLVREQCFGDVVAVAVRGPVGLIEGWIFTFLGGLQKLDGDADVSLSSAVSWSSAASP